jgi:hypothetical protein
VLDYRRDILQNAILKSLFLIVNREVPPCGGRADGREREESTIPATRTAIQNSRLPRADENLPSMRPRRAQNRQKPPKTALKSN